DVVKNDQGEVIEVLATYDEVTKSGSGFNERKPDGTIHYVESSTAIKAEFDFFTELLDADTSKSLDERVLPNSKSSKEGYIESALKDCNLQEKFQFVRQGYFNCYYDDRNPNRYHFNEIV